MSESDETRGQAFANTASFEATRWTVVVLAGNQESAQTQEALEELCRAYWYPLYVFVRRQGQSAEDAKDLVQGFFAKLIEKNYIEDANREKGRFRSFLLLALKRYMANEWDHDNRQKRGGGKEILSLDEQNTEMRYKAEPTDEMSPEKAFERQWALTLLQQVLDRLGREFDTAGKARVFEKLKVFLNGEKGPSYSEVGPALGMTESAVKVTVHRLRLRYRELLKLEIADTVTSPEAVEDEIRSLFAAFT